MFSDSAELNRIQSESMVIKDIIQKTRVILDEDGTRAGALTSSSFATLSETMNPTKAYFYADHPFAYIITDPFGNYCFMGTFWG
jgi:serpin B